MDQSLYIDFMSRRVRTVSSSGSFRPIAVDGVEAGPLG
jgi:hypothetical protein